MHKYLEIVRYGDSDDAHTPVLRRDVSDKSERDIERIESGAQINLNHDSYFTRVVESVRPLPLLPA